MLADGEVGELVFTSLTKEALPIIRYRTRDRTKLLPPTARSMRRMARVMGRTDDMLIIRGVNVFPSQIEELIVGQPHLAPHYMLEVSREGALDHLEVMVELDPADGERRARSRRGGEGSAAPHQVLHRRHGVGVRLQSRARSSARSARRSACSTGAVKAALPLARRDFYPAPASAG